MKLKRWLGYSLVVWATLLMTGCPTQQKKDDDAHDHSTHAH